MPSNGHNAGYLDGWQLITSLPPTVLTDTDEGIKRSIFQQNPYQKKNAIELKWDSVGTVNLTGATYGIKRILETDIGKTYQLRARGVGDYTGPAGMVPDGVVRSFAFRARGIGGLIVNLTSAKGQFLIPPLTFQAAAEETLIEIVIAGAVTGGAAALARIKFYDIEVVEVESDLPQRFTTTALDATLDEHFDLVSNSVGGSWHVDRQGDTQFVVPSEMLPISHVFTDKKRDEQLEYIDISAGYDTRTLINRLEITNIGYGATAESSSPANLRKIRTGEQTSTMEAKETHYIWEDEDSISQYGQRGTSVTTNIALPNPKIMETEQHEYVNVETGQVLVIPRINWEATDEGIAYIDLLDRLTAGKSEPRLLVNSLVWNAQQNLDAARRIELGQRILVSYRGFAQDALIAGIEHDITPTRWLITLRLARP